jgi:hypothetical protein
MNFIYIFSPHSCLKGNRTLDNVFRIINVDSEATDQLLISLVNLKDSDDGTQHSGILQ